MQKALKNITLTIMVTYVLMSLIIPDKVYVDRFLFNMSYPKWIAYQIYPSMYSTEIKIKKNSNDTSYSVVHHPMRIFYETKNSTECDTYNINITYKHIQKNVKVEFCNQKVQTICRESYYY